MTFLLWGDAARRPPLNFYLFLKNLTPHFGILREAQKSKAMFSCRPPTADRACFICLSPPDLRERRRDGKKSQKMFSAQLLLPVISCCKAKVSPLEHAVLLSVSVSDSCSRFPQDPSVWLPRRLPGEPCISDPMEKNKNKIRSRAKLR